MIRSRVYGVVGLALLLLSPLASASAQEEDPPQDTTFTVEGTIINHNTNEPPPEGLAIMLHAWDSSGQGQEMIHGESSSGGSFTFESVLFNPELFYTVMVTYEGATYSSEPAQAQADGTIEPIDVLVYETTDDLFQLKLELVHMIFDFGQGGLIVGEIYGLVNQGDRTVAEGIVLENGSKATVAFSLPKEAANVSFPGSPPERYGLFQGGFSLNQPLTPQNDSGFVFVSYLLPFENELTLERELPFDAAAVNLLIPHEGGMSLEADNAEYVGVRTSGNNDTYDLFTLGQMSAEKPLVITISGEPIESVVPIDRETISNKNDDDGLLIGAAALGFSLIAVGIWWWRREPEDPEDLDDELIDSMDETEG
jgi:hypothetical protein